MVDVLCIGQYDKVGKFTAKQWKCFIEWCKEECNRVIVYTRMPYRMICEEFPLYFNISIILEKPDTDIEVYAYKIYVTNSWFWDYIENCNYNFDESADRLCINIKQTDKYCGHCKSGMALEIQCLFCCFINFALSLEYR